METQTTTKTIRFAPIIRVSTESMEEKGNSLQVQTKQIKNAVSLLKGVIPENCWQYSGQEHATPEYERQRFDELLEDATKNKYDAVIVADLSRWSRDNLKSKIGLEILKNAGIRFFVGMMEYNLFLPGHTSLLGIEVEIHEMFAAIQAHKSMLNKIERAMQGKPSCGKKPFGRIWDKKTETWSIDPEKQALIKEIAECYLKGEGIETLSLRYKINSQYLWTILKFRCGDKWDIRFQSKRFNIDETVTLTIPRLLPEEMITAIHAQAQANKTYKHGHTLHKYLLSRMVFCEHCGYALFGFTTVKGLQYYRHQQKMRSVKCKHEKMLRADKLNNAVLMYLVQTLGDPELIAKAIQQGNPDMAGMEKLKKERIKLLDELKEVDKRKDNLMEAVADGLFTRDDVTKKMNKIRLETDAFTERISRIDNEIAAMPDPDRVKKVTKMAVKVLANATKQRPLIKILEKSYEWRRKLIEGAFSGLDSQGKRLGVFISQNESGFQFKIKGVIESAMINLESDLDEWDNLTHADNKTKPVLY